MRIGFDLDGVIFDSEVEFRFWADYISYFKYHKEKTRNDLFSLEEAFDWTKEECDDFFNNYFKKVTKECKTIVGAKEILKILENEGHEFYILTARGDCGRNYEIEITENRLKNLNIHFKEICYGVKDKFSLAKKFELDVMVDDRPSNIIQFANSGIQGLFMRESYIPKIENTDIIEVTNWFDIYKQIKLLEKRKNEKN